MPRYKNDKYAGKTNYVCDTCEKGRINGKIDGTCGGGYVIKRYNKPALVFCSKKCKEKYFKTIDK